MVKAAGASCRRMLATHEPAQAYQWDEKVDSGLQGSLILSKALDCTGSMHQMFRSPYTRCMHGSRLHCCRKISSRCQDNRQLTDERCLLRHDPMTSEEIC